MSCPAVALPATDPSASAPGGQSPVTGNGATEPSATAISVPRRSAAKSVASDRSTHATNNAPDPSAA